MVKKKPSFASGRPVRVRFAPSPTGDLHVGGARTALFNWLYARHTGGKFLLRIEDTDRERSTEQAVQVIFDSLKWLGLDWDEPVVYQSTRAEHHRKAAMKLLKTGQAYRCFCSAKDLESRREAARAEGKPYRYDRRCLKLSKAESDRRAAAGEPFAVRLKVPAGEIRFPDGVHGDIRVAAEEIEDFVLLRGDGTPTYMLAVVVDDIDMGITHIIRGDDHISNTPKQILLYQALGAPTPEFAHVPLILGHDKKRLSKRHGATSVTWYRDAGYLPEAMVNYLGLLGWSPGDDRNEISRRELIELFDISGIQPSSAVFDEAKLRWLNGQYLSRSTFESVREAVVRAAEAAVQDGQLDEIPPDDRLRAAWNLMRTRLHLVNDLFDSCLYLFADPEEYDPKGVKRYFEEPGSDDQLEALGARFARMKSFTAAEIEELVRQTADSWGMTAGKLIHPIRLAVSGTTVGPGLFELVEYLGQETAARRLERAARFIRAERGKL